MQRLVFASLALAAVMIVGLAGHSCSGIREECTDGLDNDADGFIDSDDPGCVFTEARSTARNRLCTGGGNTSGLSQTNPACTRANIPTRESDDPQCNDRVDNDNDGLTDADDPGCLTRFGAVDRFADDEANPQCADGLDNDSDGLTDFHQDPGCFGAQHGRSEATDPACSDKLDNDGDGIIDFPLDPGCANAGDTSEVNAECNDGRDNDGDGRVDYGAEPSNDPDCASPGQDREAAFACADGVDNDRDGSIDLADIGCDGRFDDDELNPVCSDGRDNDYDTLTDFPADPGCISPLDTTEGEAACNNGLDDDFDGFVDFPVDPGCTSLVDADEEDPACGDGIDNDFDGWIDYPFDPGCFSDQDTSEDIHVCSDLLDNDLDGRTDFPADPDCATAIDGAEGVAGGDCDDGIDNDLDGYTDRDIFVGPNLVNVGDPACQVNLLFEQLDPLCSDRQDNDGDGRADFAGVDLDGDGRFDGAGEFPPDPGCVTVDDYAESPEPQCSDGIDNDEDGTADYAGVDLDEDGVIGSDDLQPDAACVAAGMRGRNERDPVQCLDGVDNDGDGLTDYQPQVFGNGAANPDFPTGDTGCDSAFDNLED